VTAAQNETLYKGGAGEQKHLHNMNPSRKVVRGKPEKKFGGKRARAAKEKDQRQSRSLVDSKPQETEGGI